MLSTSFAPGWLAGSIEGCRSWFDPLAVAVLSEPRFRAGVQHYWKSAGSYATVGLELALSVLAGLFIGRWLDSKFGTGGWLTALWLGFGIAAGARAVWRALQRANREADEEERKDREARRKYFDEHHDDSK